MIMPARDDELPGLQPPADGLASVGLRSMSEAARFRDITP